MPNGKCPRVGEGEFKITLPKYDNAGRKVKAEVFQKYIEKVNNIFGGSTMIPTTLGCWVDKERNQIQCEEGMSITSVRDFDTPYDPEMAKLSCKERAEKLEKDKEQVHKIAKEAANELGQDSVMVVVDGIIDASFIKGAWREKIEEEKVQKGKTANKAKIFRKFI